MTHPDQNDSETAEERQSEVQVLLATYNGARFLREQIDSILAQSYAALRVLARDDGSTDGTREMLGEYAERFPDRFELVAHDRPSGSAKANFAELLRLSTAELVACADQDDVWQKDKIARSVEAMTRLQKRHPAGTPLLVFTDLTVVDEQLRTLQPSLWGYQHIRPEKIFNFRRLLTQNVVTGSTMLMNRELAVLAGRMPAEAYMHDWWVALVVSAFGTADYVTAQTVLYRQHESNVLGAAGHGGATGIPRWREHGKRREQWEHGARQAEAMLGTFGHELPRPTRKLLQAYVRAGQHPNRLVRTGTLVRNRFFLQDLRPNLAILWYLWDMKAAKRNDP